MLSKEEIKEMVDHGWIRSHMTFEVMAAEKQVAEETLKEHLNKLKKLGDNLVVSEKFDQAIEVKPAPRDLKQAFSQIAEAEIISKDMVAILLAVINFAPSSIEIIEPKELKVGYGSIQTVMNTVSDVMHRFAAQGIGGIVISTKK